MEMVRIYQSPLCVLTVTKRPRIFILEGALTVVVSFFFYFWLPDFPEEAKWLSEEERTFVKARLRLDQGNSGAERPVKVGDVGRAFKDIKIIVGGFMCKQTHSK